jgi:hypothetical protein
MPAVVALLFVLVAGPDVIGAQEPGDLRVWNEFKAAFTEGRIAADRLRPYLDSLKEPTLQFLADIRQQARPGDWNATPELYRVGNQLHGIIPLSAADGRKVTYCFTLLIEGGQWYFQHLESIFIRLDRIDPLPATRFPDLTEAQKAWMRDERRVSEQVRLFNFLLKDKGRDFAFRLFKDGAGYLLEARTWVPFVAPARAFVLFSCWEQANLSEPGHSGKPERQRGRHAPPATLVQALPADRSFTRDDLRGGFPPDLRDHVAGPGRRGRADPAHRLCGR